MVWFSEISELRSVSDRLIPDEAYCDSSVAELFVSGEDFYKYLLINRKNLNLSLFDLTLFGYLFHLSRTRVFVKTTIAELAEDIQEPYSKVAKSIQVFISLDSYKNQLSSIESTFKEYDEIIKNYDAVDITTKYESLKELENSLSQKEQFIEKKKIVVTSKLQKLKKLEEHKYDPNCTFCTTNVFVKDAIKTREELESDKVEAQSLVGEYTNLKNKVGELSYIKDHWKEYNDIHKLHVETQIKINKLNTEILKLSNNISSNQNSLINIDSQIKEYYNNKDAIEFNKTVKDTIDSIKSNIKTIDLEIKNVNNNIINYNTKISGFEEQRKTIQKSIEDVKVLEVEYEAYQLYTNAISRDGIPYELISRALPTIEKEVNNILNQIVEFTVILQTDGKNVTTHSNLSRRKIINH